MSLYPGTPAPMFSALSPVIPQFAFGSVGGKYVLLAFLPGPGPERDAAIALVEKHASLFRDDRLLFFGVLPDPESASFKLVNTVPPYRWFSDVTGEIRGKYDAVTPEGGVQPAWVLIDPMMCVMGSAPLARGAEVMARVGQLGDPDLDWGIPVHAPVLILPRIFGAPLCERLIDYYGQSGGAPSGVMIERDGKTVGVLNDFKRRRDATITDEGLIGETRSCLEERLIPQIRKVFQFKATRLERYIVARYDAKEGGYFLPHRDNTTLGTAHRKFAVSINLNAEDYEGGNLRFPEFGRRTYRPPTGGAVVFSCSLLHEATPVTRGTRYAFLPFLFDDEGARVREANLHALDLAKAISDSASEPGA